MKIKKQESGESANAKVRTPFFMRGADPESLRSVRGGDDELDYKVEKKNKLDGASS